MNFFPLILLLHQCKYIAFNIFSYRILIILYKMLIITRISNEETNELTIYGKLGRNITIFYRQELASLFQVQEKLKACRSSKLNFFFYRDFLSLPFTNHRTVGEGGGYFFNSSLPLPAGHEPGTLGFRAQVVNH